MPHWLQRQREVQWPTDQIGNQAAEDQAQMKRDSDCAEKYPDWRVIQNKINFSPSTLRSTLAVTYWLIIYFR